MIKKGDPPYLECSSKGDRRFSAWYAYPNSLGGACIEEAYQAGKIWEDGQTGLTWEEVKFRQRRKVKCMNYEEMSERYQAWWLEWCLQESLIGVLQMHSGLQDRFGKEGNVNQADALWKIREDYS